MRKQSTKAITLMFIASLALSTTSCNNKGSNSNGQKVYMRADSTAKYSETSSAVSHAGTGGGFLTTYLLFRALNGGSGLGFASNGISASSNVGTNAVKTNAYQNSSFASTGRSSVSRSSSTSRGGFGGTSVSRGSVHS